MEKLLKLNCVILCGGKSSRMGKDKSTLPLGLETLTHFQVKKFLPLFKQVFISTKEDKWDKEFALIKDDEHYKIHSPMLALYSILSQFKNEFVFILAVDNPNIGSNELIKMAKFLDDDFKIIIAKTKEHKHSLCGFYHSSLASLCKDLLEKNEQKIGLLFNRVKTKFVEFENEEAFLNLNFYEEYENFKKNFKK